MFRCDNGVSREVYDLFRNSGTPASTGVWVVMTRVRASITIFPVDSHKPSYPAPAEPHTAQLIYVDMRSHCAPPEITLLGESWFYETKGHFEYVNRCSAKLARASHFAYGYGGLSCYE